MAITISPAAIKEDFINFLLVILDLRYSRLTTCPCS